MIARARLTASLAKARIRRFGDFLDLTVTLEALADIAILVAGGNFGKNGFNARLVGASEEDRPMFAETDYLVFQAMPGSAYAPRIKSLGVGQTHVVRDLVSASDVFGAPGRFQVQATYVALTPAKLFAEGANFRRPWISDARMEVEALIAGAGQAYLGPMDGELRADPVEVEVV